MIGFREVSLDDLSIDHALEVNSLTGSAHLTVPVPTSPGRESFGPQLALGYSSGDRNTPFGIGWFLSGVPSISIDTRRELPTYQAGKDRYVFSGGQELVPYRRRQGNVWQPVENVRGNYRVYRYRNKFERSFERFEKWVHQGTGRVHWTATARNGVISVFGLASDNSTRISDPDNPDQRTFEWLLEAQYHPKGNAIVYEWKQEDGAGVDRTLSYETRRLQVDRVAQRYLKRIHYGNSRPLSFDQPVHPQNAWRLEVVFDYGEHQGGALPAYQESRSWLLRIDPFSNYRPGFEVRTYRLCQRILTFHRFPELGNAPLLIGSTELTHRMDPEGAIVQRIIYRGYRTDLTTGITDSQALPPLDLTYSPVEMGAAFQQPEEADNLPSGLDGVLYQWIDLNGEGLPGVLYSQRNGWYYKENLGDGRFGPLKPVDQVPAAVSAVFLLQDFDGDGDLNLVGFEGREAGYYSRDREQGQWQNFRPLRDLPRVDFANAQVQWVDLNGDGHPDLIVDHQERLTWYASEGADGFSPPVELYRPAASEGGSPILRQDSHLQTFFADMNGDGLLDMARVENGRVEYWPNLGRGCFGQGVLMETSPLIDGIGQFESRRMRLVDLDGSGSSDLLYIGEGEIRYWINQSGNAFGSEHRLPNLPYIDQLSSVHVFDFLGDGTRCLVWSTPLPAYTGLALQYMRLTGSLPPRLLTAASDNMGRETRLSYRSSTRDYLRDKNAGQPWHSLLPNHPLVVEKIEGIDHVGGGRLITRYEYRDGYYDGDERRFIGFGQVDAYDADGLAAGAAAFPQGTTPPSLVRSFFHHGTPDGFRERAVGFYTGDPQYARLPDPGFVDLNGLSTEDQLEGYRALAGVQWRQEFYTLQPDGSRSPDPQRVSEFAYRIWRLQPQVGDRDSVFTFQQSEVLNHEYEEDPGDPRVNHTLLLEQDDLGNVTRRVILAYPRRPGVMSVHPEQGVLHAELTVTTCANFNSEARFEVGIEVEERSYILNGLALGASPVFTRDALAAQVQAALNNPLDFHQPAAGAGPQARLLTLERSLFWNNARTAPRPAGQVGSVTLLHHVERAFLPGAAVNGAFAGLVDGQMLAGDGHYQLHDGYWWAEDSTYFYANRASFFRLERETTVSGGVQRYTFDPHRLLVTALEDVFGNRVESTPDYQVLASARIRDANENIAEVFYDPLGCPLVTTQHGRQLGSDGQAHPVGAEPLAAYAPQAGINAAAVLANPANFVQSASRFYFYDLGAYQRGEGPVRTILVTREAHAHDGEGNPPGASRLQVTVRYFDGFLRPIQIKTRAEPGDAIQRDAGGQIVFGGDGRPALAHSAERWVTSGHDVYNNKGWLIRKFEPFFSTTPNFETDAALRSYGVATQIYYDPVGRIVRQDFPNGTRTTNSYTAWATRRMDANDMVTGSAYEAARAGLPPNNPERLALDKTRAHAGTPVIVETDALGRAARVRELAAGGVERETVIHFGPLGLPDRIVDPRGLDAFAYRYDMLGRVIYEDSQDAGLRRMLPDAAGRLVHLWDARGVHTRRVFDADGRLAETRVDGALGLNHLVHQTVYGDNPAVPQAALRNARGRAVEQRDEAGVIFLERYHFDGEIASSRRQVRRDYDTAVDWTNPAAVALQPGAGYRTQTFYDGIGRAIRKELADGTTQEWEFSPVGHVTTVRISTADGVFNRRVIADGMTYNARGQRAHLRLGNAVETDYSYSPDTFRLEQLHTHVPGGREYLDIHYTYDPVGNITHWVDRVQEPGVAAPLIQGLAVSAACDFTYDAFYQLIEARGRVHQALLEHDYRSGLGAANAIKGTRHITLNNGAAVERYTRTYHYDLAGNLDDIRHQGASQNWTTEMWVAPDSNRAAPRRDIAGNIIPNPQTFFDQNGNLVRLPHLSRVAWDYANRISQVTVIDRSATGERDDAETYVYSAGGMRARRVTERLIANAQVEVTDTIYLDGCEIREVRRGNNTRLLRRTTHITDGSRRLALLHQWSADVAGLETANVNAKRLHYLVDNHLGSISLELDDAGGVISYEEYFPFGGTAFIAGDSVRDVRLKEYRYSGKLRDDTTGLYNYGYRYYAPWIGRWLSPDPLGPVDGLNLYRFVHNNPVLFVDIDGLQTAGQLEGYGTVSPGLTEAQAIAAFNRSQGLELGIRVTDLRRQGDNWVIVSYDRLDPRLLELARQVGDIEAGEILYNVEQALSELNLEPGNDGDSAETDQPGQDDSSAEEAGEDAEGEGPGNQAQDGNGDAEDGTAHPADGSGGSGNTQNGQTGETGHNGSATTGQGPGTGAQGQGRGGNGTGSAPGAGAAGEGTGGANRGTGSQAGDGPGGQGGGRGSAQTNRSSGGSENGGTDIPPPPQGVPTGENGIPWSPDLQLPEVLPEAGIPVTDPSLVRQGNEAGSGPGSDLRGEPGAESGSGMRPGGTGGEHVASNEDSRNGSGSQQTVLDRITRVTGYWHLEFGSSQKGESGGIPGGMGTLNLGGWGQAAFIALTVVDIILTIISLGESAALKTALKSAFRNLASFGRRAISSAARVFTKEFWQQAFQQLVKGIPRAIGGVREKFTEWFNFFGDRGGVTEIISQINPSSWWPRFQTRITNFDVPGTWGFRDTAAHEGFHAFLARYAGIVWKAGDARLGPIPIGAPVKYLEEVFAYAIGHAGALRIHGIPLAPLEAFGSLSKREILFVIGTIGAGIGSYFGLRNDQEAQPQGAAP